MAMTWVYYNVVRALRPRCFGFIDHDLIPARQVTISDKLANQPIYGLLIQGKLNFWSLWAGYCFYDYAWTNGKALNFLYDFSRDLDTGGRNWQSVYSHFNRSHLSLATFDKVSMKVPSLKNPQFAQFIDQHWLHIGGISYSYNSPESMEFFAGLEKQFDEDSL
jgi:hypothetical protein